MKLKSGIPWYDKMREDKEAEVEAFIRAQVAGDYNIVCTNCEAQYKGLTLEAVNALCNKGCECGSDAFERLWIDDSQEQS